MQIHVLSLTIKILAFVKAKQACLSTHDAIKRLGENFKKQKQHINTKGLAIHFRLSDQGETEQDSQR